MDGISLPNANHNQQEVQRVNNARMVALTLYTLPPFGTDLAALAPPDTALFRHCTVTVHRIRSLLTELVEPFFSLSSPALALLTHND
jgi:hypothetical protein